MRNWRKLSELMADPVLFRWSWDGGMLAAGRGLRGSLCGVCIQEGPEELLREEDVDLKYLCRTKSSCCHCDNVPGGNSLKYSLSSLILLPSKALKDHSHFQIYKETEYRVVCHENPIYIQRL